ncbi:MAG: Mur ligase [Chloroflexia bacterium]|nr:Mur ligase [Chloroflexia bacterium]
MRLVEIRELDGPNVFLLEPAMKVELEVNGADLSGDTARAFYRRLEHWGASDPEGEEGEEGDSHTDPVVPLVDGLLEVIGLLHGRAGVPAPNARWERMEEPDHVTIAFGWTHRRAGVAVAEAIAALALGEPVDHDEVVATLRTIVASPAKLGDAPLVVRDRDRHKRIVAITGTNGKTTTTRLVASILAATGTGVGWTSTNGVWVNGEEVLDGDWTGIRGARRVLDHPDVEVAILETARGGILQRGVAYQSNDVAVVTNVTADHLGLHGVLTVEGLLRVKAVVPRTTRSSGTVVLNADDALVQTLATTVRASVFLVSRQPENPFVTAHVLAGGEALVVRDGWLTHLTAGQARALVSLEDVPMTFGGRAAHMVENALGGAAACLALGLSTDQVVTGLRAFRNAVDSNPGRLNAYDVDGITVISDYAHNEAGLRHLLSFARTFVGPDGHLFSLISTAGDRTDATLVSLGKIAAGGADRVLVKRTHRYLRGREPGEMERLFAAGIVEGGQQMAPPVDTEIEALDIFMRTTKPGDVIAMMCIEDGDELRARLAEIGTPI